MWQGHGSHDRTHQKLQVAAYRKGAKRWSEGSETREVGGPGFCWSVCTQLRSSDVILRTLESCRQTWARKVYTWKNHKVVEV